MITVSENRVFVLLYTPVPSRVATPGVSNNGRKQIHRYKFLAFLHIRRRVL